MASAGRNNFKALNKANRKIFVSRPYLSSTNFAWSILEYFVLVNISNILLDNSCDPDINFSNISIQDIDTPYMWCVARFGTICTILKM